MTPEVKAALIAGVVGLVVSLITAVVAIITARMGNNTRLILLDVKAQLLAFENTFVDRLNGRYIRRPDQAEEWPMSKAEGRAIERKVDHAASIFEDHRNDVHERFDKLLREVNLRGNQS